MMFSSLTKRPRNVNAYQAAALLYGDWGTSKAYVIGLAFALAGYSSFWLILAVSILGILVGLNYITICKFYPSGGGVYASVRERSEVIAMLGAFFLIADYLVTAALSALSAFHYLGFPYPEICAALAILGIGFVNYYGARNSGNFAFFITIPTIIVVIILGLLTIPWLKTAWENLQPLQGGLMTNWTHFVGVIVAMSGIEAIANSTGVMKLNRGSTAAHPEVTETSTPAIVWIMIEVCFFTALFGFAMMALPNLQIHGDQVDAPNFPEVRDAMLRYMGEVFGTSFGGIVFGKVFGFIVSLMFCILLLSAVNTAISALISILFVMSRDGEMPASFEKLNQHGVPLYPLLIATLVPIILVLYISDIAGLANLYAVGFVGAIATNLGATSTNPKLSIPFRERAFMFATFVIMAAIELTLFIDKPGARNFVVSIVAIGLLLRGIAIERRKDKWEAVKVPIKHYAVSDDDDTTPLHPGAMLCAVNHLGKTLEFAIQEAREQRQPLYLLFIREQKVITEEDRHRNWLDDPQACKIFDYAAENLKDIPIQFLFIVSDSPADSIVKIAKNLMASRIILGMPRSNRFFQFIRGNIVREVGKILPKNIDLLVIC